MVESALKTAGLGVSFYIYLSDDDPSLENYNDVIGLSVEQNVFVTVGPPVTTVHIWNKLANKALAVGCSLFMLAADDIIFETKGWDEALIKHYEGLENKIHVYHLLDSRDSGGFPHPIISREYIDAMGYFIPPIFLHWFTDTWTIDIARSNGCFTHLSDYMLIHAKPSDKGMPDETHLGIRKRGWHDRDKYVNDTCQHFLAIEKARLAAIINKKLGYCVARPELAIPVSDR